MKHELKDRAENAQMYVVDRMNLKITEIVPNMLLDAGLPNQWWGHAILYSMMIRKKYDGHLPKQINAFPSCF